MVVTGSAVLCAVTLVWRDWVEIIFEIEPNSGSGAVNGWSWRSWPAPP
jgi:hypothetical protein